MGSALQTNSKDARNQTSIDRVINLPQSIAERDRIFNAGLNEAKRQGLVDHRITVVSCLDEIKIGTFSPIGRYEYRDQLKDPRKAIAELKANPKYFAADGVYNGKGILTIYGTATSHSTMLTMPVDGLLSKRIKANLPFSRRLTGIENVIQTIAHEIAHHLGLNHADIALYDKEYLAVKRYRSGR